jgi:hypothetical protein
LVVAAVLARRDRDGRRSFALTIAAIVLCSPVVWLHYYALLVVAVALLTPELGPAWFAPLLLWPCPVMLFAPTFWPLAPLVVFGCSLLVGLHPGAMPALGKTRAIRRIRLALAPP